MAKLSSLDKLDEVLKILITNPSARPLATSKQIAEILKENFREFETTSPIIPNHIYVLRTS